MQVMRGSCSGAEAARPEHAGIAVLRQEYLEDRDSGALQYALGSARRILLALKGSASEGT